MLTDQDFAKVPLRIKKDYRQKVNLSSNELYLFSKLKELSSQFYQLLSAEVANFNCYTLIEPYRERLAIYLNNSAQQIALTAGSDGAIFHLLILLKQQYKHIVIQSPNYFNYYRYSNIVGYAISTAPLVANSFLKQLSNYAPSVIVLTQPNGILGTMWSQTDLQTLQQECNNKGHFLILDLAYHDFANVCLPEINNFHCAIIKTFSKSHGIAGLRLGYVNTNEKLIKFLLKMGVENHLTRVQLQFIDFMIEHHQAYAKLQQHIVNQREAFISWVKQRLHYCKAYVSKANFVAIKFNSVIQVKQIQKKLFKLQIVVKEIDENILRITIADPQVMANIKKILEEQNVYA